MRARRPQPAGGKRFQRDKKNTSPLFVRPQLSPQMIVVKRHKSTLRQHDDRGAHGHRNAHRSRNSQQQLWQPPNQTLAGTRQHVCAADHIHRQNARQRGHLATRAHCGCKWSAADHHRPQRRAPPAQVCRVQAGCVQPDAEVTEVWYGFETALRLLPSAPAVMFADGFDVLVANAPTPDLVAKLPPRQVLWGAECNSWPQCLKARYDNHTAHRACLTRSQACFLNTGMGIGSPIAWRLLLDRLLPMMLTAQHADDQGAVHELYIQQLALEEQRQQLRTKPGSQLELVGEIEIAVDDQSRFGVNVFLCRGTSSYGKRGPPKSERCSYGKYSPAERLSVVGDALHFASANAGPQRPVLLHVAGNPPGQSKAAWIAPLAGLISHAAAVAGPNLDQRLVLLVDTVDGQSACRLASLGKLTKVPSQQELATGPVWKM
eukprot:scaffold4812_cov88-Phaeocystis_antarctica.AAC.5